MVSLRENLKTFGNSVLILFDDKKAGHAVEKPVLWLELGIGVCALKAVLIVLLFPFPYMREIHVEKWGSTWTITTTAPTIFLCSLLLFLVFGGTLYLMRKSIDKMGTHPKNARVTKIVEPRIREITNSIAQKARIPTPEIMALDRMDVNFSDPSSLVSAYAPDVNRSSIVIWGGLLEVLTDEEIRTVLAHESYHIRSEVWHFVYKELFRGERIFLTSVFFVCWLSVIIEVPAYLLLLLNLFDLYIRVISEMFIALLILNFIVLVVAMLYTLYSIFIPTLSYYPDIFQYEADSFAALASGMTYEAAAAILRVASQGLVDSDDAIQYVKGHCTRESLSELANELRPKPFSKPRLDTRIKVLILMYALLEKEVAIRFRKRTTIKAIARGGLHFYTNPFEKRVGKIDKEELGNLLENLSKEKERLNLKRISDLSGDSVENLLALFLFLLVNGYIEIIGVTS